MAKPRLHTALCLQVFEAPLLVKRALCDFGGINTTYVGDRCVPNPDPFHSIGRPPFQAHTSCVGPTLCMPCGA